MRLRHVNKWKEWYIYKSRHFKQMKGRSKLKKGALLYHAKNFYIVTQKHKLKRIPEALARKFILNKLKHSLNKTDLKVVRQNIDSIFEITDNGDIQLTLMPPRNTSHRTLPTPRRMQRSQFTHEAEAKARRLFSRGVKRYRRLYLRKQILYIYSKNKRTYRIPLQSGNVYTSNGKSICVAVRSSLPYYDLILAKALTIAYSPERISTL